MKSLLKNNVQLAECLEALDATLLLEGKSNALIQLFESKYPLTEWGKIDWSKIEKKIEVRHMKELSTILATFLETEVDKTVYILCDDATIPLIQTRLVNILNHFNIIDRLSIHKFIFNPHQGYVIEILFDGRITVGVLDKN